jgi:hypothetical protein
MFVSYPSPNTRTISVSGNFCPRNRLSPVPAQVEVYVGTPIFALWLSERSILVGAGLVSAFLTFAIALWPKLPGS